MFSTQVQPLAHAPRWGGDTGTYDILCSLDGLPTPCQLLVTYLVLMSTKKISVGYFLARMDVHAQHTSCRNPSIAQAVLTGFDLSFAGCWSALARETRATFWARGADLGGTMPAGMPGSAYKAKNQVCPETGKSTEGSCDGNRE